MNWIPEVPKEEIIARALRIKPTVRFDGILRYIKAVDLFNTAYAWDPEPGEVAPAFTKIAEITTYHTYGFYGFFKPSVAEVLAQIPDDLLDRVNAFEIVGAPETADDLNANKTALNAGYHVARTALYA